MFGSFSSYSSKVPGKAKIKKGVYKAITTFQTLSFNASPLNFCLKLLYKCFKQCLCSELRNNSSIASTNPTHKNYITVKEERKWKTNEKKKKKLTLKLKTCYHVYKN